MTLLDADDQTARIAAIIVTYNSAATLGSLLASLDASTVGVRAIVVDNGSADDTLEVAAGEPRALTIATGANLGYSGGINIGRSYVRAGEHVAILNPDLTVEPDMLERLLEVIEADPEVGIAVPQLRRLGDGKRYNGLRREPSVARALGESLFGDRWTSRPRWLAETMRADSEYERPRDIAWGSGAALLISNTCNAAIGEWDAETYFLYAEETDYARRAREAGFRVRYQPGACAHHEGSGSGQPAPLVALVSVNRVRYYERLHGRASTRLFHLAVTAQHALRMHDPRHRYSLPIVLNRSRWSELPAGDLIPDSIQLRRGAAVQSSATFTSDGP
ncbi:glycosyltransferase family 2 protein [Microbacterium sp. nov. GSS16]|uniref:glycosyltransferase family 2 protein n=1 Tax=Microbacterium sp. nov. GSS16 TaxID=3019890 RepID=UPI0023063672|nr:glycosyltransferase family 2 protein [Microbacterium sp. nov. GSS16]WCD92908.1 glycosyltransferase family 2 protein [Microbacterium sp. nov. GSS16]